MARLKSRTQCPPNGFIYVQRETGWRGESWEFNTLCRQVQQHRQANTRLRLNTNIAAIEVEVDEQNAERVMHMNGAESYIMAGGASFPKASALPTLAAKLHGAVEGVKKIAAGAQVLLDWEESGEPPVDSETAIARAMCCTVRADGKGCPLNGSGGITDYFTKPASEWIRKRYERLKELKLTTPFDDKLNVCEACLCPLKLKVHTPMKFITPHLTEKIVKELDPQCWILKEREAKTA